jgi:hypothetical protein
MAVSSTIEYCSERDLKDIYPGLSGFDTKIRVYNWQTTGTSNLYLARNSGLITQLFSDGEDLGDAEANSGVVNANGEWYYDSNLDTVYYFDSATAPNDRVMESGEDWATLKTRQIRNASRYLESKIDGRLSREIWKDREGEYPYIIKRTTALIAVTFLVRADDPANPVADAFMEEADSNIEQLNSGAIQLPNAVTYDSSKGVIRDVTYTSGSIRPVKTRGRYSGTYDLVKIKIGTGGALGTATYNVYAKDSTKLKNDQVVTEEVITGDYQSVAGGLQIRFAGSTDSSVATANNEWEIELYGSGEQVSNTELGAIHMSRGGYGSVWR